MTNSLEVNSTLLQELKNAKIFKVEDQPTLIIEATTGYIPFDNFQQIFTETGKLVIAHKIEKLVFDKRKMTTFHQPSMEWYYTQWKEEMLTEGLKKHRKILPDDKLFRHSVNVGREKIFSQYPSAQFTKLDIQYAESIEEALAK